MKYNNKKITSPVGFVDEISNNALNSSYSPDKVRSLIIEKEKELHDMNEYRIQSLEHLMKEKEAANIQLREKLCRFQEDFEYNLKLLEGRDEELKSYDVNYAALKVQLRDRETEISELKSQIAEAIEELNQERQAKKDVEMQQQGKIKDVRGQMERLRWNYEDEIKYLKKCIGDLQKEKESIRRTKDDELDQQRREWNMSMDKILCQQELAYKGQMEKLESELYEMRSNLKEEEFLCQHQKEQINKLHIEQKMYKEAAEKSEKEKKEAEWKLEDLKNIKDAEIIQLKDEVVHAKQAKQSMLEEYEKKMAQALDSLHTMEKALEQKKVYYHDELKRQSAKMDEELQFQQKKAAEKIEYLTAKLQHSEEKVLTSQDEAKRIKWSYEDRVVEYERDIERLQSELKGAYDAHQRESQKLNNLLIDAQRAHMNLQERVDHLGSLTQRQEKNEERLCQQIVRMTETEEELKQQMLTQDMAWERKLQDVKHEHTASQQSKLLELQQNNEQLQKEKDTLEQRIVVDETEMRRLRAELLHLESAQATSKSYMDTPTVTIDKNSSQANIVYPSATLSPLWSGDHGPPVISPLSELQSFCRTSNGQAKHHEDRKSKADNAALTPADNLLQSYVDENNRLRNLIHEMKDAIATNLVTGMLSAQKEVAESQTCHRLREQVSFLEQEISMYRHQIQDVNRSLAEKDKNITELENALVEARDEILKTSQHEAVQAEIDHLRMELSSAHSDIDRLVQERGRLMELSNQLSADTRRLKDKLKKKANSSHTAADFSEKNDYENLIADLMKSLEESRQHNKILKKELRRMIKMHRSLAISTAADQDSTFSNNARSTCKVSKQRAADSSTDRSYPVHVSASKDECKVESDCLKPNQLNAKDTIVTKENSPEHHPVSLATTKHEFGSELQMAGKKVNKKGVLSHGMNARMSARETPSQQQMVEKLQKLQIKRAGAAHERIKVRNYNER